jgi:N-acetyl-anhydromuramoyl-L-alanine amidase
LPTAEYFAKAERWPCTHFDDRPANSLISLLVIHNISLPPGQFGSQHVKQFFAGELDANEHPYFADIHTMRVSAHCFVDRLGKISQLVPFSKRAWHAGLSSYQGVNRCNDYSIGIELEGTDDSGYSDLQYRSLLELTRFLMQQFPLITLSRIVGHNDIAPGRKTDPGVGFNWPAYRQALVTSQPT